MKRGCIIFIILLITIVFYRADAQDSLSFKGQFSAFTSLNSVNSLPWWTGGRYIPQLNYEYNLQKEKLLDFEVSVNLYGNAGYLPFDSVHFNNDFKPYRLWARYSADQFEIRAGLQKINFGSASILRPLMWFERIDPRDPLKLTDGVWGLLFRYYFLNNSNIWLWGLYGNKNLKGWEFFKSKTEIPEFGGRFQIPFLSGEAGFSYHHRTADGSILSDSITNIGNLKENRLGFDVKFDMITGWWVEASWSRFNEDIGKFSNQEVINIGLDYTFSIGNGITATYEHLVASNDRMALKFENTVTFSLLNITYPVSLFDRISGIVYYDWTSTKIYNFINWQRQFNRLTLYLMGYVNPKEYEIPAQDNNNLYYAGNGVQLMLVFNY